MDKHKPNTLQELDTVLPGTAFCFPTLAFHKRFHLWTTSQKNEKYFNMQN